MSDASEISNIITRVSNAIKNERKRFVFWTNLSEGRYELWRWKADLSEKTHIIPLGSDPGGVNAKELFDNLVMHACAHAAVEAMREPTEEMLKAGFCHVNRLTEDHPTALIRPWQAMIDVVLGKSYTNTSTPKAA